MSFRPEVQTTGDSKYYGNAFRFATYGEANQYVQDLAFRWTAVVNTRVVPSDDAVNALWKNDRIIITEAAE